MAQPTLILSVEGNIGVGKSTMLNRIKKILRQYNQWKKDHILTRTCRSMAEYQGKGWRGYFTKFYSDQEKYTFLFR